MTRLVVVCQNCKGEISVDVELDPSTATVGDLKERVVEKFGLAADSICPHCQSHGFIGLGEHLIAEPDRVHRTRRADAIAKKIRGIRFAVGAPDGPRSGVWRVWLNNRRDDVYIAARNLASILKVSLHPDYWYMGFTDHFMRQGSPLAPPSGERKQAVWSRPPEFGPGWTRAFSVIIPASEVVAAPTPYEGSEVLWFPRPPDDEVTHFTILFSTPGAARGRRGFPSAAGYEHSTEFVTKLDLATGESVWVVAHNEPATAELVEQVDEHANSSIERGRELLAKALANNDAADLRAILFREDSDGARSIVDVSLASRLGSIT